MWEGKAISKAIHCCRCQRRRGVQNDGDGLYTICLLGRSAFTWQMLGVHGIISDCRRERGVPVQRIKGAKSW